MPRSSQELPGLSARLDKLCYHHGGASLPADQPHAFVYFVTIRNGSDRTVTLLGRKWVVEHCDGTQLVIEGDKIVGETPRLAPGEQVEVIAVEQEGMPLRLALTVHVLPAARTPPPTITVQNRAPSAMDDRPLPFGAFSLTGVVFRIIPGAMALHTRNGEQDLVLRANTRYMEDGNIVEPSALKLNMHVFVEAGKTLYGEIEAYRVVWGGILKP